MEKLHQQTLKDAATIESRKDNQGEIPESFENSIFNLITEDSELKPDVKADLESEKLLTLLQGELLMTSRG